MEFRLIYNGRLPAATGGDNRSQDKHRIRKILHKQLKELWNVQAPLSEWTNQKVLAQNSPTGQECTVVDVIASLHAHSGFRFVPIVTESHSLCCELEIIFLRRDAPGRIISGGGDIDNRLKVLFDALRMPKDGELGSSTPDKDEYPFFVLLEDDSLITKVTVTTDRLLLPRDEQEHQNDVHLVIGVRVIVVKVSRHLSNLQFLG